MNVTGVAVVLVIVIAVAFLTSTYGLGFYVNFGRG